MLRILKITLAALVLSCGIVSASPALAEDDQATPTPIVSPTPAVQTPDLGANPRLLPDSPFYFLKEWKRSVQMLLTTNTVNKTELAEKIANEKLIELQKLTEKGVSPELIQKATEKYQQQVERVKKLADKIKGTAENNPEVNKFLDKFTQQQELHEQILQKLEQQVPPAVLQKIKDARESHLEKFKQVMQKLETRKDQVKEKLEKVCIQLYSPVCGKDGKTYGNNCLAKVSGVEVAYEGECAQTADCNYYYWTDNANKECGSKQFCGMFMYLGLKTFDTKGECLKAARESAENILGKSCSTDADCGNPNPATPQPGGSVIQYRCVQNKCALQL